MEQKHEAGLMVDSTAEDPSLVAIKRRDRLFLGALNLGALVGQRVIYLKTGKLVEADTFSLQCERAVPILEEIIDDINDADPDFAAQLTKNIASARAVVLQHIGIPEGIEIGT